MNKPISFLILGVIFSAGISYAQTPAEKAEQLDRELLRKELNRLPDLNPPDLKSVERLTLTEKTGGSLKSLKADIGNPPDWNWVRAFTGSGGADIIDIVVDGSNNVYAFGTLSDSMEILGTALVSTGLRDVFIAKIGSFGNLSWIVQLKALPDENLYASWIALSPGGVVVLGDLASETISGGGKSATREENHNLFMARFASDGTVDWIKTLEGLGTIKLMADADNNIYKLTSQDIRKYNAAGDEEWVNCPVGQLYDFTLSDNGLWISGAVSDTGIAVGDSVFHWYWESGAFFLARIDANGNFGFIEFMPTYFPGFQSVSLFIEVDGRGDICMAANTPWMFIRDSLIEPTYWGSLIKVDSSMNVKWLNYRELSNGTDFYDLIRVDDNQYFVYGYFQDSISFDGIKVYPDYDRGYFFAEFDSTGNVKNIYDYETYLYVYKLTSGNTLYSTSYDNYDHWLHKKNLSGAESWTIQVQNNGGDASIWYTMDIDEDGNLYAQGYYRGTVQMLGSRTKGRGVFFIKFRNDGTVEWFKSMENPDGSPSGIVADDEGNVYAWGGFSSYIKMEGQEYFNDDPDGTDIYLVKFDRDGDLKFVKQFDGTGYMMGVGAISLSPENDILLCGPFSDTLRLGAYTLATNPAYYDMFITKISPNGNVKWARQYGGPRSDWARSIVSDSLGNIYFTGAYRDSISLGTTHFSGHQGSYDFLLAKLDPNGNVQWAKNGGPENYYLRGHSIALHGDRLYIQGLAYTYLGYLPDVTFGDKVLTSEFEYNSFLASYDLSGDLKWAKLFKVNNYSWPLYNIETDPQGNVYAGGIFQDTLVVESHLVAGSGGDDYYVLKYSPDGTFQWMKTSETGSTGEVNMFSLCVFEEDVVLVGGRIINGSVTIGGETIRTASSASFVGLIGEDIIGCSMELSVETVDEDFGEGNGSATLTISGGTAPYSIQWSNGEVETTAIDSLFAGTYQVAVVDAKDCEQFEVFPINIKNGPVITLDEIGHVSCNGYADGFVDISVTGGTQPYTYYWDNGYTTQDLTNLMSAPYSVTVTDANGLIAAADYYIQEPKPLDVAYTIREATCGGGTDGAIEVFTSGGTKPYDWEWNTGVFTQSLIDEPAGKYTLTVLDANNCELEVEIALSEKDAPIVETEYIEPATCNVADGAAGVRVANAVGNITYLWSDAASTTESEITGQRARGYFVTATNEANCKSIHLVRIPEKRPLDNQICLVTVDTAIGSNLVVWEKVEDAISYHVYRETTAKDVYLLAGSVVGSDLSVFVDTVANPLIRSYRYKIAAVDECGNESFLSHLHKTVHLTISTGLSEDIINLRWDDYVGENFASFEVWRYTSLYSWELLATLPSNLKSYTDFAVPPGKVFYNVRVPMPGLCEPTGDLRKAGTGPYSHSLSNMDDNKLKETTGFQSRMADMFYVYPNPTNGKVTIWSEAFQIIDGEILVSDLAGRLILHRKFEQNLSGRLELDLTGQPAGSYLVKLNLDGQLFYQKLVIQ